MRWVTWRATSARPQPPAPPPLVLAEDQPDPGAQSADPTSACCLRVRLSAALAALLGRAEVGRCRSTVSTPVVKAPTILAPELEHHQLLSDVPCKFISRRYTEGDEVPEDEVLGMLSEQGMITYPSPLLGTAVQVGPMRTVLKAPGTVL